MSLSGDGLSRLCVLVSGRGRNLQAIHAACVDGRIPGRVCGVVSNRPGAAALDFAQRAGIDAVTVDHTGFATREAFDAALVQAVREVQPDWVILAGFMRVLTPVFLGPFANRVVNIHPSLLPRHPGLHTHRAVLAAGEAEHGASVHFVTDAVDGGPVLVQGACSVRADDDEQRLAQRVLEEIELRIYPQAVRWLAQQRVFCDGGRIVFDEAPLAAPLTLDDLETCFR